MIYQPPTGARDLLPIDVAQKHWIEHRLQDVFRGWSYHPIITPTLERLDTLMAGEAVRPETVIQVWDAEEGILGLRPELTASIARAAATRMVETYPQRLSYAANIFRRQPTGQTYGQHEFYQAGVELLGAGDVSADAEVLLLLADALSSLRLKQWHLVLGDAGLTRSLLWDFPKPLRAKVRQAIAQLNRVELEQLPLETTLRDRALKLMDLRGEPVAVLQQVGQWSLDDTQLTAVQRLKSVVDLIEGHPSLTLDLSLIQTFDYYTGLVFEVVSDRLSGQRVLGQGGRYDRLVGLYHPQGQMIPGIGFSLNMEDLQQVLMGQLPQRTSASHWLVVPASAEWVAEAFRYAQQLRHQEDAAQPMRVEVELEMRSPEQTRIYAQHRQIRQIAWVHGTDSVTVESLEATT